MWKYTIINKKGKVQTDIYKSDMNLKASEVCKILESCDFEVLELKKVNPLTFTTFLNKIKALKINLLSEYNF